MGLCACRESGNTSPEFLAVHSLVQDIHTFLQRFCSRFLHLANPSQILGHRQVRQTAIARCVLERDASKPENTVAWSWPFVIVFWCRGHVRVADERLNTKTRRER